MSEQKGNAHGRHITEEEKEADAARNHNKSGGRNHGPIDPDQKAGGHSDRHASHDNDKGQQHEFRDDSNDDDENRHSKPQNDGRHQGASRNEGGHQGGRNQP